MDTNSEVIDLCDVKTIKSEDTAVTIPFDGDSAITIPFDADDHVADQPQSNADDTVAAKEEIEFRKDLTEQWVFNQDYATNLAEFAITHQPLDEKSFRNDVVLDNVTRNSTVIIPAEVTELVTKDCAIKLINHLVIYAINKFTETKLRAMVLAITPDIDPQINHRICLGFHAVYDRCIVLFYEALTEFLDIYLQFTAETQDIVKLWIYDMVENMCRPYSTNARFLREEKYVEKLICDYQNMPLQPQNTRNIFFDIYQRTIPTVAVAVKKPRKPRASKTNNP